MDLNGLGWAEWVFVAIAFDLAQLVVATLAFVLFAFAYAWLRDRKKQC